jgi:hypothetical protein
MPNYSLDEIRLSSELVKYYDYHIGDYSKEFDMTKWSTRPYVGSVLEVIKEYKGQNTRSLLKIKENILPLILLMADFKEYYEDYN